VPERHHVVTLFWDALLAIGHAHSFPRLGPDYYPCGFQISPPRILNGFDSVFGRAPTAKKAVSLSSRNHFYVAFALLDLWCSRKWGAFRAAKLKALSYLLNSPLITSLMLYKLRRGRHPYEGGLLAVVRGITVRTKDRE
jgi:hypothetical protein